VTWGGINKNEPIRVHPASLRKKHRSTRTDGTQGQSTQRYRKNATDKKKLQGRMEQRGGRVQGGGGRSPRRLQEEMEDAEKRTDLRPKQAEAKVTLVILEKRKTIKRRKKREGRTGEKPLSLVASNCGARSCSDGNTHPGDPQETEKKLDQQEKTKEKKKRATPMRKTAVKKEPRRRGCCYSRTLR